MPSRLLHTPAACALTLACAIAAPGQALAAAGRPRAATSRGPTATGQAPTATGQAPAATGGAGLSPSPGTTPAVSPDGNAMVTTVGGGLTLATRASGMLRRTMIFTGSAPASMAGDTVEIERLGHQTGWTWAATVSTAIAANGSFEAAWKADHIGRFSIRAVVTGPSVAIGPAATLSAAAPPAGAAATAPMTVTVYRRSLATQYGPGFYGRRTACGIRLHRDTIGVANRSLPCGTQVAIYFRGATMVVTVIDRGPYANGADWDLTTATARAIGISGSSVIGAVSLPAPAQLSQRRRAGLRG